MRNNNVPNILILGHAGSGKTTIAVMVANSLNISYMDSSTYCLEEVVYPALKDKYGYKSAAETLEDKDNRRSDWYDVISAYNEVPDRLTREILENHNIYVGMRSSREFEGSKHHFDLIVWIDVGNRIPDESSSSMDLNISDATYILRNDTTKEILEDIEIPRLVDKILSMITPDGVEIITKKISVDCGVSRYKVVDVFIDMLHDKGHVHFRKGGVNTIIHGNEDIIRIIPKITESGSLDVTLDVDTPFIPIGITSDELYGILEKATREVALKMAYASDISPQFTLKSQLVK